MDYIIIGQGICGTFLSWNLWKAGKKFVVIDQPQPYSSTKVASGVINPVTGRRIVKTWMIDELLPFSWDTYTELGHELNAPLIQQCNILDFHPTLQMKEAFAKRLHDEIYLQLPADEDQWKQYFNYHYGIGEINPCYLIDLNIMLHEWRKKLQEQNALLEEQFSWNDCKVYADHVKYQNITAQKIICCDGVLGFDNPYFKNLPYVPNKGEVIIASIPGLPRNNIFKQGINIVPWKNDLFWIGSSYEWNYPDKNPTAAFRKKVEDQLNYWLKLPYTIVDHWAAERPTNLERRPFVGLHPVISSVGLLNGMGTKGCSLAPYFAKQLTELLTQNIPINPQADVKRFTRILSL